MTIVIIVGGLETKILEVETKNMRCWSTGYHQTLMRDRELTEPTDASCTKETKNHNHPPSSVLHTPNAGLCTHDAALSQSAFIWATFAPISLAAMSLQDFNTTDRISLIVIILIQ